LFSNRGPLPTQHSSLSTHPTVLIKAKAKKSVFASKDRLACFVTLIKENIMSKIKAAITQANGVINPALLSVAAATIQAANISSDKSVELTAKSLRASVKGTKIVAVKTLKGGRGLARRFAKFGSDVMAEVKRQEQQ
jgi:hypothetical protein